jgi:hypothetical protein
MPNALPPLPPGVTLRAPAPRAPAPAPALLASALCTQTTIFEHERRTVLAGYADGGGLHAYIPVLTDIIITPSVIAERVGALWSSIDAAQPMHACGACGVRGAAAGPCKETSVAGLAVH